MRTRGRGEVYTGDEVYTGWGSGAAPSDSGPVVSSLCWVPSSSWSARVTERSGGGLSACRWGLCAGTRKGEASDERLWGIQGKVSRCGICFGDLRHSHVMSTDEEYTAHL